MVTSYEQVVTNLTLIRPEGGKGYILLIIVNPHVLNFRLKKSA